MEEVEEPVPSLADLLLATAKARGLPPPDLSVPSATGYLEHLLALPLPDVVQEAERIGTEAGSVENELTNLCYREYPTFISVHNCSSAVTSAFDDFESSLGRLLDAVPALEEGCRTFTRATAGVQKARARAALVQEHQDKLFDLLEIPQLMDTCVRNGYYQEALELSAHTEGLVRRYPGIELVQDVAKEVDGVLQLMLAQLLALLREPIKLPALVKTVGYLRRLGTIDEGELSLVFLISRLSNFKTHLVGLERDRADAPRYVRKYVDLFREHVFDIISQFTAIFLDNSAAHPSASTQLASFVEQCVSDLVDLVSANVPKMTGDTAALSSILVQIGYCSLAFARVGLDFAPLVTEPFSDAVLQAFSEPIEAASTAFAATLAKATKSADPPAQVAIAPEYLPLLLASPDDFVAWDGTHDHLPGDLARLPPLAILVNAHLSALNALRLLAPLHLYPRLAASQSKALLACTHSLAQYVRAAAALADPAVSQPHHSRSGSGRAHLIRRNSETQLTPESRAQRRRETQAVCVAFARTWANTVCPLLAGALARGIFESAPESPLPELVEALAALNAWADDVDGKEEKESSRRRANGGDRKIAGVEEVAEPEAVDPEAETVAEPEPPATEATAAAEATETLEAIEAELADAGLAVNGTKSEDDLVALAVPEPSAVPSPAPEPTAVSSPPPEEAAPAPSPPPAESAAVPSSPPQEPEPAPSSPPEKPALVPSPPAEPASPTEPVSPPAAPVSATPPPPSPPAAEPPAPVNVTPPPAPPANATRNDEDAPGAAVPAAVPQGESVAETEPATELEPTTAPEPVREPEPAEEPERVQELEVAAEQVEAAKSDELERSISETASAPALAERETPAAGETEASVEEEIPADAPAPAPAADVAADTPDAPPAEDGNDATPSQTASLASASVANSRAASPTPDEPTGGGGGGGGGGAKKKKKKKGKKK